MIECYKCAFNSLSNTVEPSRHCDLYGVTTNNILGCDAGLQKFRVNADTVRDMSDNELAHWINEIQSDAYNAAMLGAPITHYPNHLSKWIEWLTKEKET